MNSFNVILVNIGEAGWMLSWIVKVRQWFYCRPTETL